jgi:DNA-binding LacI/PurR family transcriptional regulator
MATSADVAHHAGLSRSTVSQIFNGHEHLFSKDTIAKVRASAVELGYRPSVAGRTLARGTSDIVLTLIPDVTFNPRLRELVDTVTEGLAAAGLTNLLRFVGSTNSLEDAILGLKPYGIVSLTPLNEALKERLLAQGVHLVEQPQSAQIAIDEAIGRLQARHLASAGYEKIVVAAPVPRREQLFSVPRANGAEQWAIQHGLEVLPAMHIALERGGSTEAVRNLPKRKIGIAAYNDDIAMAVLGALLHQGRSVPEDIGIIGIDNSHVARAATPSITTVDYDITFSGHGIVQLLLQTTPAPDLKDPVGQVEQRLRVVQGETTNLAPEPLDS